MPFCLNAHLRQLLPWEGAAMARGFYGLCREIKFVGKMRRSRACGGYICVLICCSTHIRELLSWEGVTMALAVFMVFAEKLNLSEKWSEAARVADIFACYFAYGHRSQYSCGIDTMYLFKRVRKDTAQHADKPHFYVRPVLTKPSYSQDE